MKVHFIIPYSNEKNLGKAYNDAMRLIPDGDHACFLDYDVLMLTPDAAFHIHEYARRYPDALLTSFASRIHLTSPQLYGGELCENADLRHHLGLAEKMKKNLYQVTPITKNFSGFLMVLPKSLWYRYPFSEDGQCLGVDTDYWKRLIAGGDKILRMDGIYVWHTYRLLKGVANKNHLM
jgi:GT2 family glycosyltransferase